MEILPNYWLALVRSTSKEHVLLGTIKNVKSSVQQIPFGGSCIYFSFLPKWKVPFYVRYLLWYCKSNQGNLSLHVNFIMNECLQKTAYCYLLVVVDWSWWVETSSWHLCFHLMTSRHSSDSCDYCRYHRFATQQYKSRLMMMLMVRLHRSQIYWSIFSAWIIVQYWWLSRMLVIEPSKMRSQNLRCDYCRYYCLPHTGCLIVS